MANDFVETLSERIDVTVPSQAMEFWKYCRRDRLAVVEKKPQLLVTKGKMLGHPLAMLSLFFWAAAP